MNIAKTAADQIGSVLRNANINTTLSDLEGFLRGTAAAPEGERPKPLGPEDGLFGRVYESITRPRLSYIDKNGVLFKKDDTVELALEKALQFSPAATATGRAAASPQPVIPASVCTSTTVLSNTST